MVRCEDARFHWEASGADRTNAEMLERALADTAPEVRERQRERWREAGMLPGQRRPTTDLVAVIYVEQQAATVAPWLPDSPETPAIEERHREFYQFVRYLWHGHAADCAGTEEWPYVDLWIQPPCCDTPGLPGDDGCLLRMYSAVPAPPPLRGALAAALARTN